MLDLPVEVVEPTAGVDAARRGAAVRAERVSYRYGDGPVVLRDVSVDVPAGAHVAIVGETGSGRPRSRKLLSRLADPTRVGSSSAASTCARLRRPRAGARSGWCRRTDSCSTSRCARTSGRAARARPIARSRPRSTISASATGSSRCPTGIDTRVGERGEWLSVGERQLVSLARAQLGSPGVLILDEATSAVDPATERRITEALRRLSAGRTTITIAHRLSTAEGANEVFVFDAGHIVERGTHAELVEVGGTYAGLYRSWLGNVRI